MVDALSCVAGCQTSKTDKLCCLGVLVIAVFFFAQYLSEKHRCGIYAVNVELDIHATGKIR